LNDLLIKGLDGRETLEKSALTDTITQDQKEVTDDLISDLVSEIDRITNDSKENKCA